jgi:hypothetical protein
VSPATDEDYAFADLSPADRPPEVQYTPNFDPEWVYPTGAKAGGTRDDVPVQGLELGVAAREETLRATVEATLRALAAHHEQFGHYPRHRIVADHELFCSHAADGVGLAALVQPRPTVHDGLTDHFKALAATPEADLLVAPNYEPALRLAARLAAALARQPETDTLDATLSEFQQIADTPVFERYAPLGAESLYDPVGGVDFEDPDAETVAELSFTPASLDIDSRGPLRAAARHVTTADEVLGIVSRG